jgi:PIN domain nuclease of toxin-antitoxin system
MRFLIDTHVFLWFINGDTRLSQTVRTAIEEEENDVLLSIASVWEIAIKNSIGKLGLTKPFAELIPQDCSNTPPAPSRSL